jgi:hypothetical protein
VRTLALLLKEDGKLQRLEVETRYCFRPEFREVSPKQMDLFVGAGQMDVPVPTVQPDPARVAAGVCGALKGGYQVAVCLDFTLRDGTCATYRVAASRDVVQGLVKASVVKVQTYVESRFIDCSSTTLISLAFDQFGTASRDAHAFFRAVAIHQAQQLSGGLYTVASCVARWRQRLSCLLHRILSDQVIAAWECTAPIPGRPAPDLNAYKKMRLLCPPVARAPSGPLAAPGAAGLPQFFTSAT